mgnify:CR=1 FL=1
MIMRPEADDETRTALLDRIREIITKDQGVVGKTDEWGKRRFAYEINHVNEGYYYVMYFKAEPKTLDEVTRVLKISDTVLRIMPVRLPDKGKVAGVAEALSAHAAAEAGEAAIVPAPASVAAVAEADSSSEAADVPSGATASEE